MISQLLVNGIITGTAYALVAMGFALIYSTTKTFHFAHGAVYTLAAYLFYTLFTLLHVPMLFAIAGTIVVIAICGVALDRLLYAPLVAKASSPLVQMLSSLGLYIVTINVIAIFYGNEAKTLSPDVPPTYQLGGIILTRSQILIAASSIVMCTGLLFCLRKTRLGKFIRAMRDDPALVSALGVDPQYIRRYVFAIGSAFAAVAAALVGLDVGIDPHIGMPIVLTGAIAMIVGGVGVYEGAAFGAVLLGILQSLAIWRISARWQEGVTFIVLIAFLLLRPEGIFGTRRRVEESAP